MSEDGPQLPLPCRGTRLTSSGPTRAPCFQRSGVTKMHDEVLAPLVGGVGAAPAARRVPGQPAPQCKQPVLWGGPGRAARAAGGGPVPGLQRLAGIFLAGAEQSPGLQSPRPRSAGSPGAAAQSPGPHVDSSVWTETTVSAVSVTEGLSGSAQQGGALAGPSPDALSLAGMHLGRFHGGCAPHSGWAPSRGCPLPARLHAHLHAL